MTSSSSSSPLDGCRHHHLIHDPEQVKTFARLFLPDDPQHVISISLISRRKYTKIPLPFVSQVLQHMIFAGPRNPDQFHCRLMRLETPYGSYFYHDRISGSDAPIPPESLAVYAHLDQKHSWSALQETLSSSFLKLIRCSSSPHDEPEGSTNTQPPVVIGDAYHALKRQISLSPRVPNSPSYRQIDIDSKEPHFIEQCKGVLSRANVRVLMGVETRQGFHLVYDGRQPDLQHSILRKFQESTAFCPSSSSPSSRESRSPRPPSSNKRSSPSQMDYLFKVMPHPMIVVPGTMQGGYPAHLVDMFSLT